MADELNIISLHKQDVVASKGVQIKIRQDGLVVWINVDGILSRRILLTNHATLEIDDNRK